MKQIQTTCPYCGVGCGISAVKDDLTSTIRIEGDENHPANRGQLCVKGSALAETLGLKRRLLHPQIDGRQSSWREALDEVAGRIRDTQQRYGPDSIAFYLSGQLLTEDYYVANKLMKGFLGSANVDTNSRLCMSSAVAAHVRAFGEDVVPCSYSDLDNADLIILVGSNAAWAHPIVHQRIAARQRAGAQVVVIDPRRTATASEASIHLQIRPGGDLPLFDHLLAETIARGHVDEGFVSAHVDGLDQWRPSVTASDVERQTGLDRESLASFVNLWLLHDNVVTVFSQGVNQSKSGSDTGNAIINCHLATGRIGRAGAGPFSMTGQPNAMGGREVGGLANQLASHRSFDAKSVDAVSRYWRAPNMATKPGLKAVDMFAALQSGSIRLIWIMGTNPAVSMPDSSAVRDGLSRCRNVIVSDCHTGSDTASYADILLPAAAWGEKDGTVTNSERTVSRQRAFIPLPESVRPDWRIVCDVAALLGHGAAFAYDSPGDVFEEHARLSGFENGGDRQFDISPLAETDYDAMKPTSWPLYSRPFVDHAFTTVSGRAQIVAAAKVDIANIPDNELRLNSGRLRDQWHTMTRTGEASSLNQHQRWPELSIAPTTMDSLGLGPGDLVRISRADHKLHDSAVVILPVKSDPGMQADDVFAPIHWSDRFSSHATINRLYDETVDPVSGQPASKSASVRLHRLPIDCWIRVFVPEESEGSLMAMLKERVWFSSRAEKGFLVDIAGSWNSRDSLVANLDLLLEDTVRIEERSAVSGRIAWQVDKKFTCVLIWSTERSTLAEVGMLSELVDSTPKTWLDLGGSSKPEQGRLVCSCFEVSETSIRAAIHSGKESCEALGKALQCGTNCGSCVPELNQLIAEEQASRAQKASC